jgi:hypothetical protein
MRDDNTEPRDNQQIADDSQQSGRVGPRDVHEQISGHGIEEGLDEDEEDEAFLDDEDQLAD